MRYIQILLLFTICLGIASAAFLLFTVNVYAFSMESEKFRLELPDVLGEKSFITPKPQLIPTPTPMQNPVITRGFPESKTNDPFSFTISSLLVDFGILSPTDPVTRTTNIIVHNGKALGYTVLSWQDHPLREEKSKEEVKDTTCDTGSCNQNIANSWTNPLVFGAGFRADNIQGETVMELFRIGQSYFKQFSDLEASESPTLIMTNSSSGNLRNDEIRVTYKVNVPATQKSGVYQNTIYYVAVPDF